MNKNIHSEQELSSQMIALKVIFVSSMTIEEKKDELFHLSSDNLSALSKHCQAHEEFELCAAIKAALENKG